MKKSNQELIQQKNSDHFVEEKKLNKSSAWLWALVVFMNFALLAGIFHVVWNLNFSELAYNQKLSLAKIEDLANKLEIAKKETINKAEKQDQNGDAALLELAANKYHVALYSYRILEKFKQDQNVEKELEELSNFEKFIESKAEFNILKTTNFSEISKTNILEALVNYEKEFTKETKADESSWVGKIKNQVGTLVKIEPKEQLEKNKAMACLLYTSRCV